MRCKQFATDMLELCITKQETELLLNYCPEKEARAKHPGIPKINDAIAYEQKEVFEKCISIYYDLKSFFYLQL